MPEVAQREARRATIAAGVGTLIEGYDLLIYGYLATVLAGQFFPTEDPATALLNTLAVYAVGFAVRPLGGLVMGHVGDRGGRRGALTVSFCLTAGATLGIGLLPTYHQIGVLAPVLLLIFRLMQGFSIGGEYVGANILILEHAATGWFGRTVSVNQVAAYLGAAVAAATSLALTGLLAPAQLAAWGWRLAFLVAVPLGLVGLYLRARVPDGPAFREATVGRARFPLGTALRTARRGMLVFAGWIAMVTVGGYLLFGYLPTYLIRVVGLDRTAAFAANLAAMVGLAAAAILGGYLIDRYPTPVVAVCAAAVVAVAVVPGFAAMHRGGVAAAVVGQLIWGVGVGVAATVSGVLSVALFPARIRYTATAFAYNITVALLGGTAPYLSTWLISRTGSPTAPAWYLVALTVPALAAGALGMRTAPGRRPAGARSLRGGDQVVSHDAA
jgi:MHS family proline/betaine transporter-like MFS transporter